MVGELGQYSQSCQILDFVARSQSVLAMSIITYGTSDDFTGLHRMHLAGSRGLSAVFLPVSRFPLHLYDFA